MLTQGLIIGFTISIGWILLRHVFYRIDEGSLGIVSRFGAALKSAQGQLALRRPGLHLKAPWHHVRRVPLREQALELTQDHAGQLVMADDGTTLRLDSVVRYTPLPERLEAFQFGLKSPLEHLAGLFSCLLRNELANLAPHTTGPTEPGAYSLIRRERKWLNERLATLCRAEFEERYGVRFTAVHLVDIHPPDDLAQALNAVMTARVEAQTTLSRAEAENSQRVLSAREGVDIARLSAEGVEREITEFTAHLAQLDEQGVLNDYVARRRAEVVAEAQTVYLDTGAHS